MPTASEPAGLVTRRRRADQPSATPRPYRWIFTVVEAFVALGGLIGTVMLVAGVGTPPLSAISSLGLSSWVVPGLWLFVSVTVPSATAAVLAGVGSRWAPVAVLVASACLVMELAVQIPFLGFSVFQPVFGLIAVVMAVLALLARDAGWWPRPR
ncbi:MAG TPA: hypothetical protein VMT69_05370 [Kineosporiaceae bacterium]|nr:hypothetical protein [Kineosporiaceae bacterium]